MTKLQKAYEALIALMRNGAEFPDAVWEVASTYKVPGSKLTAMYDGYKVGYEAGYEAGRDAGYEAGYDDAVYDSTNEDSL